jgi:hypothetical protein
MLRLPRRPKRHRDRPPGPRWRVSYANVAATLALVIALAGGTAYAASKIIITKPSQISTSVRKALHGATGPAGAPGAVGAAGLSGPAGGESAWAEIASNGTIVQQSGGITMTPGGNPSTYGYCLNVPGTIHLAVASADGSAAGAIVVVSQETLADPGSVYLQGTIAAGVCSPSTNLVVITENASGAGVAEAFNLIVS